MTPLPGDFADRLLAWHRRHGRHDLPWQGSDPYRVWVSEIMLQQTQVATVIPYYERFMARFPTLAALAQAPLDEVLAHWSGLGYYARARNLHAAAQRILSEHQGRFPTRFEAVLALPGIGPSTAGAILSLALGQPHPILDGNVKRVLCRHFAIAGWPGKAQVTKRLWRLAEALTPKEAAGPYNQAIMDLGATLCRHRHPQCSRCPVESTCLARAQGQTDRYPHPKPRRERPSQSRQFLLIRNPLGELLLERRPPTGLWGGLLSPPELPLDVDAEGWLEERLGRVRPVGRLPRRHHDFSHFRLHIHPRLFLLEKPGWQVLDGDSWLWYNPRQPAAGGLPRPVERLLQELDQWEPPHEP